MVEVLDLELNGRAMVRGGREVESSLRQIETRALATGRGVDRLQTHFDTGSRNMIAFGRSGLRASMEFAQLSQTIPRLAGDIEQFGKLSGSTAQVVSGGFQIASSSLNTFLFAGQNVVQLALAASMSQTAAATGKLATTSSALALIWKAHPILTIATVLATVTAAVAALTGSTDKQAASAKHMAEAWGAIAEAQARFNVSQQLGLPQDPNARLNALRQVLERIEAERLQREVFAPLGEGKRLSPEVLRRTIMPQLPTGLEALAGHLQTAGISTSQILKDTFSTGGITLGLEDVEKLLKLEAGLRAMAETRRTMAEAKITDQERINKLIAEEEKRVQDLALARETLRMQEIEQASQAIGQSLASVFAISPVEDWRERALNALRAVAAEIQNLLVLQPLARVFSGAVSGILGGASPSSQQTTGRAGRVPEGGG